MNGDQKYGENQKQTKISYHISRIVLVKIILLQWNVIIPLPGLSLSWTGPAGVWQGLANDEERSVCMSAQGGAGCLASIEGKALLCMLLLLLYMTHSASRLTESLQQHECPIDSCSENVSAPGPEPVQVPGPIISGPNDWSRSQSQSFMVPMIGSGPISILIPDWSRSQSGSHGLVIKILKLKIYRNTSYMVQIRPIQTFLIVL